MPDASRKLGWDKKAVNRLAKEHYGSLQAMLEAHGWVKGEKTFGQIAPTLVKNSYGSVDAFVRAHDNGLTANGVYNPMAAIEANPPNVWLTSFYGYNPEDWGLLAFGRENDRDRFVGMSEPGALIVVYGTKDLRTDEAGVILGIQQVSHQRGLSKEFISPSAWNQKQSEPDARDRWRFAVNAV